MRRDSVEADAWPTKPRRALAFALRSRARGCFAVRLQERPLSVLRELGPGFWNAKAPLYLLGGLVDVGNHMSLIRLASGRFLAVGALDPDGIFLIHRDGVSPKVPSAPLTLTVLSN